MLTQLNVSEEDKSQATANDNNQNKGGANPGNPFVDNRTEALEQKKMQEMMKHSPKEMLMESNEGLVNNNSMLDDSQSKENIPPFQLEEESSEDESSASEKKINNNTGLPDNLKTGAENLSGFSLDDVNVHYNSEKPADLQALAYAQGTDIHLAPGQEEHLPHELGHVVQQKEGDVKPNAELNGQSEEIPLNNDAQLEKEADLMGDQALKTSSNTDENTSKAPVNTLKKEIPLNPSKELAVQRVEDPYAESSTGEEDPDYDPNAAIGTGEEDPVSDPNAEIGTGEEDPVNDPNAVIGTEEENPVCDPNAEIGEPVLEDEEDKTDEKKSLLNQLANNVTLSQTHPIILEIPLGDDEFITINGNIKFDLGNMSKVESELNISYERKSENGPVFKPFNVKLSNKGEGLQLVSFAAEFGNLATKINLEEGLEEFSSEFNLNGLGIGLALNKDGLAIKPKMDVMAILFGPQIEEAVKKWSESLGEGIEASVKASLPFEGTFLIPLQQPLSMRIDKMNFNPEFSFKIITNAANGFGVDVGASASIESDYADGSDGDEFSTTTGTVKTHMKVIVFGEEIGVETEATSTHKGTLWESVEMQKKLLGICAKEAYKRVHSQFAGNDSANSSSLATLFNSTLESTWKEGVSKVNEEQHVNIDAVRAVSLNIYQGNANEFHIENEADIINKVIQEDETSKMIHEAIVFSSVDEISGQYEAKSGNWNRIISLTKNGNNITGEYEGGSLSGNLNNQIITGLWYEEGESGGNGDFVLQVQENGNRLYGKWIDENKQQMDWVLEKL